MLDFFSFLLFIRYWNKQSEISRFFLIRTHGNCTSVQIRNRIVYIFQFCFLHFVSIKQLLQLSSVPNNWVLIFNCKFTNLMLLNIQIIITFWQKTGYSFVWFIFKKIRPSLGFYSYMKSIIIQDLSLYWV